MNSVFTKTAAPASLDRFTRFAASHRKACALHAVEEQGPR
jgi:hypothetical protein